MLWLFSRGYCPEDGLLRRFGGGVGVVCLSLRMGRQGGRGDVTNGRFVLRVDENSGAHIHSLQSNVI